MLSAKPDSQNSITPFTIQPLQIADYDAVLSLWQKSDGVGLSDADSPANIAAYLQRNPRLSVVTRRGDVIVAAALCGHDGRRGFIHHLAVDPAFRRQGLGRQLAEICLQNLRAAGIQKSHLFVFYQNEVALRFWQALGWEKRSDITILSAYTAP